MKVVWETSQETEKLRLLNITACIANGFFKHNGFLVLPVGYSNIKSSRIITLPELNYNSIPRFWQSVARLDYANLIGDPKSKVDLDIPFDLPLPKIEKFDISKIWPAIYTLIPRVKNNIRSLHIWQTGFGSTCSFSLCNGKPPFDIYVWLRSDQGESALVEAIITSITRPAQPNASWSESEATVDWIMSDSAVSKAIRTRADLTITDTRSKASANLQKASDDFLARIGAPQVTLETIKRINTIDFSQKEKQLFQKFLDKPNQIVSFDEIGDENDFSLYAITKLVQRLRDKMEAQGITGSLIQSKRGEGYILAS